MKPFAKNVIFTGMLGGSTAELVISCTAFLLFLLGSTQVALNYKTKALVNSATFQGARQGAMAHGQKGAMAHGQKGAMRDEIAQQLVMLYGHTAKVGLSQIPDLMKI